MKTFKRDKGGNADTQISNKLKNCLERDQDSSRSCHLQPVLFLLYHPYTCAMRDREMIINITLTWFLRMSTMVTCWPVSFAALWCVTHLSKISTNTSSIIPIFNADLKMENILISQIRNAESTAVSPRPYIPSLDFDVQPCSGEVGTAKRGMTG